MEGSPTPVVTGEAIKEVKKMWWIWLAFGIAWMIVGLVILQFDSASISTVGVIIGLMFIGTGCQNFVIASLTGRMRWLWAIFGVFFIAAGIVAFVYPKDTFAAVADILGFLFLLVGIFWMLEAFATREVNELWWLGLIASIMMLVLAFWTAGQFFIEKAFLLLVFAGIWSLMQGVIQIVRAFQIKHLDEYV